MLRAIILLGFAGFIFKLHYTGEIGKYINMKYVAFSQIASVLLVFLFFIQLYRTWIAKENEHHHEDCGHDGCDHDHGFSSGWSWKTVVSYTILIVPLVTGFLMPAKTLDASIASNKGVLLASPGKTDPKTTEDGSGDPSANIEGSSSPPVYFDDLYTEKINEMKNERQIQMANADRNFVSKYDTISLYPEQFKGMPIEMMGFVYKEEGLMKSNQLVLSRFIITHCVADAGLLGFLAQMDEASQLEKDTWIQVKGTLDLTTYGDMELPIIKVREWKVVDPPKDPYVYP
ncbi:TIGR03943 family protein [Ammoniphilus sp. 3BR4]|uniref:TIGR03943 family putative permease subunit n=1 Tax=Ammoniphilus sp. 3BR4 TaxID=3158265 RepID=UPI0034654AC2